MKISREFMARAWWIRRAFVNRSQKLLNNKPPRNWTTDGRAGHKSDSRTASPFLDSARRLQPHPEWTAAQP
jgi:hypothetical protein